MGMVPLKCPGCGANIELDDSREFGFCNFCGTKVMQKKVVVEHRGSVKLDNSESLNKFITMAKNAIEAENGEEAINYVNKALEINPESSAAWFEKMRAVEYIATDKDLKINETILYGKNTIINAPEEKRDEVKRKVNNYYLERARKLRSKAADNLNDSKQLTKLSLLGVEDKDNNATKLLLSSKKLSNAASELERQAGYSSNEPSNNNATANTNSNGGCYVATAVYGSYDCPQVWTLRRYRDNELAKTWYGRVFIHTYYSVSPTIVKLFGDTQWFKHMWRGKLDRMVNRLNSEGVENTPYNDIDW